eukprot:TRINITY_DN128_c0_g1_i1.p1 TRINITY_DN128_c0_g1~~TRINITY_DN128_c0_g1_i1.p1  ORF type:complete len:604 (+),score=71.24 TRINITY_DN128_c0_g1_i1:65-1813(+)
MAVRLPIGRWCPAAYSFLVALHLEHLLECNRLRAVLMLSCAISFGFALQCLYSVLEFKCFGCQPWTAQEIGQYTRPFRLLEGSMMLFLFYHTWRASLYYIEGDEERIEKKEKEFVDLEVKTEGALKAAIQQANRNYDLLQNELSSKVQKTVRMMRKILECLRAKQSPDARRVHRRLSREMARSLHQLRKPAFMHFKQLIELYDQSGTFLEAALKRAQRESMIDLLVVDEDDRQWITAVQRTETAEDVDEDTDDIRKVFDRYRRRIFKFFSSRPRAQVSDGLKLPTQADLNEELRDFTEAEMKANPDKVVLRPLLLVLKWLGNIEVKHQLLQNRQSTRRLTRSGEDAGFLPHNSLRVARSWWVKFTHRVRHSGLLRCMTIGFVFSSLMVLFYMRATLVAVRVMHTDDCGGFEEAFCAKAVVQRFIGVITMVAYTATLAYIIYNIEVIDQHFQFNKDMQALNKASNLVQQLNTNELANQDSRHSLWQIISNKLSKQHELLFTFFEDLHIKTIADFESLTAELAGHWGRARTVLAANAAVGAFKRDDVENNARGSRVTFADPGATTSDGDEEDGQAERRALLGRS